MEEACCRFTFQDVVFASDDQPLASLCILAPGALLCQDGDKETGAITLSPSEELIKNLFPRSLTSNDCFLPFLPRNELYIIYMNDIFIL